MPAEEVRTSLSAEKAQGRAGLRSEELLSGRWIHSASSRVVNPELGGALVSPKNTSSVVPKMGIREFPLPGSIQDRTRCPPGGNIANMSPGFDGD